MNFEETANEIDEEDNQISGHGNQTDKYKQYGRPYLVASGFEEGIKYRRIWLISACAYSCKWKGNMRLYT